ncbi:hypothetical protein RND71_029463 [Anisodus tanguticus]|uniref:FRIGIDA-like protein n=1 Tax=Anisodus tanguticus TaxID=243964 RepID=A0AAE1RDG6_9SOLA|nr:hypothetical protein RND71_029463 [Anisodus tanguticus]
MIAKSTAATATPQSLPIHVQQENVNPSLQHDSIAYLSDSLSAFKRCFTELPQHIDSIRATIHSVHTTNTPLLSASLTPVPSWESDQSPHNEELQSPHHEQVQSPYNEELQSAHHEELRSSLESLCKASNGRFLRSCIVKQLSDMNRLLEQLPKALRLSSNPARLVLECMGRFYLQWSDAYTKGSHMVRGRRAAVLVLQCFLLMGMDGVEIDKGVKQEAEKAALAWRNRLILEGGVRKASEMDARGLLLLIGCFGIPGGFTNEDIRNLLQVSAISKISRALWRSNVLMPKIPEIIEGMVKQNMKVDAVNIAYTFGIEDRFNPRRLLTSFLLDSKESLKKMKGKSQGSLAAVTEAKVKHLFALKSVIRCLKRHDVDPSKLLPGWKIDEKIMTLEKEITGYNEQIGKKMAQKRKIDETESSRRPSRRFRNKEAKTSRVQPWLRQQRVDDHVDINNTLLEGRTTGHLHGYTVSSSVLHGPAAGSMRENVAGSLARIMGGVAMGGTGASISAGTDVVQQGGSYAGSHGGTLVDNTPGKIGSHTGQLYGQHGFAAVYDRLASCSYAYRPSSYLEGSTGLSDRQLSDAYRPPPYSEGSTRLPNTIHSDANRPLPPYLEGSMGLPNTLHSDAYRPPPYLEGSKGLPNAIPVDAAGRSSASDIYQVADTDTASELYMSSGLQAVDAISSAASAHPLSYLYWPR